MPSSTTSSDAGPDVPIRRRELGRFAIFLALLATMALATWIHPVLGPMRPWVPGEPIPLLHLLVPDRETVEEDAWGEIRTVHEAPPAPSVSLEAPAPVSRLPVRPPAVPTPLDVPPGALDHWFEALSHAEAGEPGRVVRTCHWGDSTIAADGITSRVRSRLQARFGDGGPGFLALKVDPRWQSRPGVARWVKGDWSALEITFGGAEERRYGLAGVVSTATGEGTATLGGIEVDGIRQPLHRFDVFYQRQPGGGTLSLSPKGAPGARISTASDRVRDAFRELRSEAGSSFLFLKAVGDGPVTVYGVALETAGPGVTWETFGVAGASVGSMLARQASWHLRAQIQRRSPDLIVYQTGGNELEYPGLKVDGGAAFRTPYLQVLSNLEAGVPEASCLVIGPLDQARRERGKVVSKPNLEIMIRVQQEAAREAGCAFWDARHAMGGEGAFARWLEHEPRVAWTDLIHLTSAGLDLVGDSLADALLDAYDTWKQEQVAPDPLP
ncbi:MAG: hypothetical protein JXB39_03810 [Deltaproteobacteria bacterium]|nr:hypothetical protein [Deltaproteobacteria bacterium]